MWARQVLQALVRELIRRKLVLVRSSGKESTFASGSGMSGSRKSGCSSSNRELLKHLSPLGAFFSGAQVRGLAVSLSYQSGERSPALLCVYKVWVS